ncbi:5-deoxy-glucuronate isomerase [Schaalia sp. Marseille-Q2122]|uniref:5-deoxy-glucuronate isomerase n=1 Tax=Schaalia sp. Marseille-Q2122 TaxID=2736604 RepID=UPI00158BA61C|nr:5-deoxy-glucuronate isomerase [Schaalia sp. Marseille-Q2122]
MTDSRYVIRAGELADANFDLNLTPEKAGWDWSALRILTLPAGGSVGIPGGDIEYLVLPLTGGCEVEVNTERFTLDGRTSPFTDITDYLYVPRGADVTIVSHEGGRFALPGAKATADLPVRYCPRSEVVTTLRGAGPSSRQVNNYALGNTVETSHLLACEVLTPGGNWSSYPPHKHDEHTELERILEEIYYYEIRPGHDEREGFALQRIYPSPGHDIDVCTEVHSGDIVIMPYGYHGPSVAAPGYDLYYQRHGRTAEDSVWLMTDDPHHTWVRQTWQTQEVDPRLPMTPMNP